MNRTAANRLVEARISAGYESSRKAADDFGWVYVTYNAHENGNRGIRPNVAEKYAAAFRVATEWLLFGVGAGPKDRTSGRASRRVGDLRILPETIDETVLQLLLEASLQYLTPTKLNAKQLNIDVKQGVIDIIGYTNTSVEPQNQDARLNRFHQSVEQVLANILRDHGVRHYDLRQSQHVASAVSTFLAEAAVVEMPEAELETG